MTDRLFIKFLEWINTEKEKNSNAYISTCVLGLKKQNALNFCLKQSYSQTISFDAGIDFTAILNKLMLTKFFKYFKKIVENM